MCKTCRIYYVILFSHNNIGCFDMSELRIYHGRFHIPKNNYAFRQIGISALSDRVFSFSRWPMLWHHQLLTVYILMHEACILPGWLGSTRITILPLPVLWFARPQLNPGVDLHVRWYQTRMVLIHGWTQLVLWLIKR